MADAANTTPEQALPERECMDVAVMATTETGEQVAVQIRVLYPAGRGFTAAKVVESMPQKMDDIYRQLLASGDQETLMVLAETKKEG